VLVHLLALPTAVVRPLFDTLPVGASMDVIAAAVEAADVTWPEKGKMIVEINPGTNAKAGKRKVWMYEQLVSVLFGCIAWLWGPSATCGRFLRGLRVRRNDGIGLRSFQLYTRLSIAYQTST
jgi:hypothetical protein